MTIGWGIIATAGIADRAIAPAINKLDGAELVGVVSRDQGRADAFASRHSCRLATTSRDELLADPGIQIVYVATPNSLHPDDVIAAAAAGKHVLCEKPLGTSLAAAEAAVAACTTAGVKLGINFQTRHHRASPELRQLVTEGAIGEVSIVQCEIGSGGNAPTGWRTDPQLAGLGAMNNLGVHAYDLLRYVLGSEVVEVTALLDVGRRDEIERTALALLRFENGTLAYVNANQSVPNVQPDIALYGTEGRIVGHGVVRFGIDDANLVVLTGGEERVIPASTADAFDRAVAAFQAAVVANEEPSASGFDGLRSLDLTDALAQSAREGRVAQVRRRDP